MKHYDAIVVGGGPAGITAALYLCRSGISVAQIEMLAPGGQILKTESIENYPGFPKGIKGWEMADAFAAHLDDYELDRYNDAVLKMEQVPGGWSFSVGKETIVGKAVVVCSGANPRPLGVPRETQLTGRGVSYCALCDGNFFRDKEVMVVGGGNTAAADVIYLARICRKVYLVHRCDKLRATAIYHERLRELGNVEFCWDSIAEEFIAGENGRVTGLKLRNVKTDDERVLAASAVFIAIGMRPYTAFLEGDLETDGGGYIVADAMGRTTMPTRAMTPPTLPRMSRQTTPMVPVAREASAAWRPRL